MLPRGGAIVKGESSFRRGYYKLPRRLATSSSTETSAGLFWKGKGFALAGTGDAVETLSRDKTAKVLR